MTGAKQVIVRQLTRSGEIFSLLLLGCLIYLAVRG
jgi:hypothetical protein